MLRLPINVLKFTKDSGIPTELYEKFKDYCNHYKAVNFGAKLDYDKQKTFEDKNARMHKDITDAINKLTNIKVEDFTATTLRANPMYK